MPPVDFALDEHVRPSLQRKGARIGVEFSPFEGALDIEGSGVVPLDEIRIMAVHDADVIGQFRRAVGVQTISETHRLRADFDREIHEP